MIPLPSDLRVQCRAFRHLGGEDLQVLVDACRGDVPLIKLRFQRARQ
jgi:hypothetical protein